MKNRKFRVTIFLMALCMLLSTTVLPVQANNPGGVEYLNTHVNTGNQREDIVAIALTQVGYREKDVNDTKYGDWYGYPGLEWCAMFVSWCALQADVSTDIVQRQSWAHPGSFGVKYYHGNNYTPQPGDLFFTESFSHVGLVWYVEGDFFYCIEGNARYHDYTVPHDPTIENYHVMTNKRLISDYYFGVPEYEGCDKDHDYIKSYESAHPHKAYYACQTCGDTYYTGYTECVADCAQCFTCGCSSNQSGYYLVSDSSSALKMYNSHGGSNSYVGYATVGEAVYVHGTDPNSGWAYIEYDGQRGHIKLKYLTAYYDIPASPQVSSEQTDYVIHNDVTVTWNAPAGTEQYRLKVFRDGALYAEQIMDLTRTYTMEDLPQGNYEVQVIACNCSGASAPGVLKFTVLDTYTLTYDACGGTGAPAAQTQAIGEAVTISDVIPVREGYTFLGWTMAVQGNFVEYGAGDALSAYGNITLYAVWKRGDASLETITIEKLPACMVYLKGESLDTSGLALRLTYSDGSGHVVTGGYTTEGFDSETYGTKTITVLYDALKAVYEVQVVPYLPGDIDLNKTVNRDDVMQLLWHISFPDEFPVTVPVDFNGDGAVNRDDVMQLLWHISFPDQFPLAIEWPEEETPTDPAPEAGSEGGE